MTVAAHRERVAEGRLSVDAHVGEAGRRLPAAHLALAQVADADLSPTAFKRYHSGG